MHYFISVRPSTASQYCFGKSEEEDECSNKQIFLMDSTQKGKIRVALEPSFFFFSFLDVSCASFQREVRQSISLALRHRASGKGTSVVLLGRGALDLMCSPSHFR